jgi:glutamine synthetase
MNPEELKGLVNTGEIDTVVVAFTDIYGRLLGKRFDASFFIEEGLDHGTDACNYLLTADMEMEPMPGYAYSNWERGYGDFHLRPDLKTLRRIAWADRTALVLADLHDGEDDELLDLAPRSLLHRQVERLAAAGYSALGASELEFFLFEDSYRDAHGKGYRDLEPAGWYLEDYHLLQGARVEDYIGAARRALAASEIPVETSKGEWGRGQHELNIRYAPVLEMADRHTIMKQGLKELAEAAGRSITFMAKPSADEAGSSCHLHISLNSIERSANVFDANGAESDEFRWFLGGWIAHVREFMVFYAPTVNSYKRYRDASWAPTRLAWSRDNRTAGFRIVGSGANLRIECRLPGADTNPYLAFSAALASGLAGIEQRIEPPDHFTGDAYAATDLPQVPMTLSEATAAFASSDLARETFGTEVVDHYVHFFETEQQSYDAAVTDWERARYFERI